MAESTPMENLLTVEELANYLAVPIKTIYSWNSNGLGPKRLRIGKYVRYRQSDVEHWIACTLAPTSVTCAECH